MFIRCEWRAAEVGLILVVAARLVVRQIVEATLVEEVNECGTLTCLKCLFQRV